MRLFSKAKKPVLAVMAAVTALGGVSMAQQADPLTATVLKRYYLTQVDARCHLLDSATAMALKAGFLQARNAAIRAGTDMTVLGPYLDRVRDVAARTDCASTQLSAESATVTGALRGFLFQATLDLPTGRSSWTANRRFEDEARWRLVQFQQTDGADLALGLYGTLSSNRLAVMAHFSDGAKPYSARLLVRDPAVLPSGVINRTPYGLSENAPLGFTSSSLSFVACASSEQPAELREQVSANSAGFSPTGKYVGAQGPEDAVRFDFPGKAFMAIARLDPREDVVVAFDFPDGTRYARFEVGDMITGLAYAALPSPYGHE